VESTMAPIIFKGPPQWGQCCRSISNTRLRKPSLAFALRPAFAVQNRSRRFCEQAGPAQAGRRRGRGHLGVVRWGVLGFFRHARNDLGTQPGAGCEHPMEADQMQPRMGNQRCESLLNSSRGVASMLATLAAVAAVVGWRLGGTSLRPAASLWAGSFRR
jgi:hypothetical protein